MLDHNLRVVVGCDGCGLLNVDDRCGSHVVVELQGCPVVAPVVVACLTTVVVDQL